MRNDDVGLENIALLAGGSCPALAEEIARILKMNLCKAEVKRFSDGESSVQLLENVRGKHVYIVQSMGAPANDNLMELLLMADACRRASAADVVAIVPYLGYSRQDRRPRSARVPISARIVADMISVSV